MSEQDAINGAIYIIHHWREIAAYSGGALGLSVVLQWLKHHFKLDQKELRLLYFIKLDGPRIVVMLFSIFTALGTAVGWLIDPSNARYIPEKFLFLLTAAFYIHRFMVSPLGQRIENQLKPWIKVLKEVRAQELARQAAAAGNPQATIVSPTLQPATPAAVQPFSLQTPQGPGK